MTQGITRQPLTNEEWAIDLNSLWNAKWQFAICLVVTLGLGAAYLCVVEPDYQVSAKLLVEQKGSPLSLVQPAEKDKDFLPTQAEIIRSPAVIRGAIQLQQPNDLLKLRGPEQLTEFEVARVIEADLNVSPLVGTNVLSVRYRNKDTELAVHVIESILASYREFLQSGEHDDREKSLRLLTEREGELRKNIENLQQQYRQMQSERLQPSEAPYEEPSRRDSLRDLGQVLANATNRRIQLENHLQFVLAPDSPAVASDSSRRFLSTSIRPENGNYATLRMNEMAVKESLAILSRLSKEGLLTAQDPEPVNLALMEAQIREAELAERFGNKHPDLCAVRRQIATLETRLYEAAEAAPNLLQRELHSIRKHETQLAAMYQQEYEHEKLTAANELEQQHLMESIQRTQAIHDTIHGQLKQVALVNEAVADGDLGVVVRVLEGPTDKQEKVSISPAMVMGLCGMFGLLGGFLIVCIGGRGSS